MYLIIGMFLCMPESGYSWGNIECKPNGCRILDNAIWWIDGHPHYEDSGCVNTCVVMTLMCANQENDEEKYRWLVEAELDGQPLGSPN